MCLSYIGLMEEKAMFTDRPLSPKCRQFSPFPRPHSPVAGPLGRAALLETRPVHSRCPDQRGLGSVATEECRSPGGPWRVPQDCKAELRPSILGLGCAAVFFLVFFISPRANRINCIDVRIAPSRDAFYL